MTVHTDDSGSGIGTEGNEIWEANFGFLLQIDYMLANRENCV